MILGDEVTRWWRHRADVGYRVRSAGWGRRCTGGQSVAKRSSGSLLPLVHDMIDNKGQTFDLLIGSDAGKVHATANIGR